MLSTPVLIIPRIETTMHESSRWVVNCLEISLIMATRQSPFPPTYRGCELKEPSDGVLSQRLSRARPAWEHSCRRSTPALRHGPLPRWSLLRFTRERSAASQRFVARGHVSMRLRPRSAGRETTLRRSCAPILMRVSIALTWRSMPRRRLPPRDPTPCSRPCPARYPSRRILPTFASGRAAYRLPRSRRRRHVGDAVEFVVRHLQHRVSTVRS